MARAFCDEHSNPDSTVLSGLPAGAAISQEGGLRLPRCACRAQTLDMHVLQAGVCGALGPAPFKGVSRHTARHKELAVFCSDAVLKCVRDGQHFCLKMLL
mmetsp:Transcript_52861/g.140565  ORF Transcript_52861/g.140565 Transcript_52861/m.140565 type:complete len:100 (-) Transcript_52861:262-561(-)